MSDFESACDASGATCDSVCDGTITTAAMYETGPVCDAVDCAAPTDGGATAEEGMLSEAPDYFKSECIKVPPGNTLQLADAIVATKEWGSDPNLVFVSPQGRGRVPT